MRDRLQDEVVTFTIYILSTVQRVVVGNYPPKVECFFVRHGRLERDVSFRTLLITQLPLS
jgi:hypothetical protein